MIRFLFKTTIYLAIVVAGGVFALDQFPSLKADIIEIVNPREKEAELISTLRQNLEDISLLLPEAGAVSIGDAGLEGEVLAGHKLLEEAQDALDEIAKINEENSGTGRNLVSKAIDALFPGGNDGTDSQDANSSQAGETATPPPCVP